ncbi:hypothetical protein [Bradyrhizobium pachyrhizi]|uniref:hypothetical protein n=1 Tax=Bradyrhizobium pachyrhizi TaxID=280333 RepID=UPI0018E036BE|nr:hypothetical protein [Bradyrhizobium pachyrhizi]
MEEYVSTAIIWRDEAKAAIVNPFLNRTHCHRRSVPELKWPRVLQFIRADIMTPRPNREIFAARRMSRHQPRLLSAAAEAPIPPI